MHIFLTINYPAHVPHNEEVLEILSIQVKEIESNSSASECDRESVCMKRHEDATWHTACY